MARKGRAGPEAANSHCCALQARSDGTREREIRRTNDPSLRPWCLGVTPALQHDGRLAEPACKGDPSCSARDCAAWASSRLYDTRVGSGRTRAQPATGLVCHDKAEDTCDSKTQRDVARREARRLTM